MRQLIAPLILFFIAIGLWLSDRPSTDTSDIVASSADITTADKEVAQKEADTKDSADTKIAKKRVETKNSANTEAAKKRADTKDSADTEIAKERVETKDPEEKMMSDDIFPLKYLTNWETGEGLLALTQAPESETIRGIYYHPVRTNEVRGKIVTKYINKRSTQILSGFWFQSVSDKKCDFEKNGTYYWGRLAFAFKDNSFEGIWGYFGEKADYTWNGKRV